MTDEETVQKLVGMKLTAMAQAFRDLLAQAPGSQMSLSEQAALMIDREWTDRENRRLSRLMRAARLSVSDASLENVWCDPARGIDKAVIRDLATGKWIRNKQNVIVCRPAQRTVESLEQPRTGQKRVAAGYSEVDPNLDHRAVIFRYAWLLNDCTRAYAPG